MKGRVRGIPAGMLVAVSLFGTVMYVHGAGLEMPAHLPIDLRKIFAFFSFYAGAAQDPRPLRQDDPGSG